MLSILNIPRHRWISIGIIALAGILRLALIEIKPPHFDEGVNGWFVDEMTRQGYYHYDATNYHGPLHFYVLFLFQTLFGRNLWALRLPIVVISTASVFLIILFDRFLNRRACWFAALAMAVSPAAVFFGRYAIHESWLVFFSLLGVWGLAGLWRHGNKQYLWAFAMGATGMILTKETYIIHAVCLILAAACLLLLHRVWPVPEIKPVLQRWHAPDLISACGVSLAFVVFFYSGAGLDPNAYTVNLGNSNVAPAAESSELEVKHVPGGLNGLYTSITAWANTGGRADGHDKTECDLKLSILGKTIPIGFKLGKTAITANYYWLKLITHYEWPILGALLLVPSAFLPRIHWLVATLAIYGCGAIAAYSLIPYKTPWCIISLLWPFFIVFGWGVDRLMTLYADRAHFTVTCASVVTLLLAASLYASYQLNFFHYDDEKEPYVYVQTFKDIEKLTRPLEQLVESDAANYHLVGSIIRTSYHPLPWLLGDFTQIGFYEAESISPITDADFLLVEESRIEEIEKRLNGLYFKDTLHLRSGQEPSTLYLSAARFGSLFSDRTPTMFTPVIEEPVAE